MRSLAGMTAAGLEFGVLTPQSRVFPGHCAPYREMVLLNDLLGPFSVYDSVSEGQGQAGEYLSWRLRVQEGSSGLLPALFL